MLSFLDQFFHGRKPGGLGGRSPQNVRWGKAHASVTHNILRSSVVGSAQKYEKSKKVSSKELFSEIGVFLVKKGSNLTAHKVKIRKTWSMTKEKGHQIFWA